MIEFGFMDSWIAGYGEKQGGAWVFRWKIIARFATDPRVYSGTNIEKGPFWEHAQREFVCKMKRHIIFLNNVNSKGERGMKEEESLDG